MTIYNNEMPAVQFGQFTRSFLTSDMLLLDIETTGLSPAKNYIYCIGCSFPVKETISIQLFFAEEKNEEREILKQLSVLLASHSTVITFNGTAFDIPFLRKRYARYDMDDPFLPVTFLDLYQEARQLKTLLCLENYRQKSLELFLGCSREDTYSGKELIDIYLKYVSAPDPESQHLLLTHNYEDVKGMYDLIEILSYRNFLNGHFLIQNIIFETDQGNSLLDIILTPTFPLPQSIHRITEEAKLILDKEQSLIQFPVHTGMLRHYFPDYQNYYYLPEENTIIHKSVGAYVESSHRQKATKENCFLEKECTYLSLSVPGNNSFLKKEYSDRQTYLDLSGLLAGELTTGITIPPENYPRFYDFVLLFLNTLQ